MATHGWYVFCPVFNYKGKVERFIEELKQKHDIQAWKHDPEFRVLSIEIRRPSTAQTLKDAVFREFSDGEPIHLLYHIDGEDVKNI